MKQKPENPFFNIAFNILIPVVILNKGHLWFSKNADIVALLLALAFPLAYGLFDLFKNKRKNLISVLGALNVCFTGGFALFHLSGIWFAIKEALFPLLIGMFVLISAYTKKNFFESLMRHCPLNWHLIEEKTQSSKGTLKALFKKATIWFSLSFFVSAILNFILAMFIFSDSADINPTGSVKGAADEVFSFYREDKDQEISSQTNINKKIADMTWMGFLVIGLPLTLFSAFIFWRFLKGLCQLTNLSIEQIFPQKN